MKVEKIIVNDKIAASCQTNNIMSTKLYFKRYKQQKRTLKNSWANKLPKTTVAICFSLLQVCLSMPPFVFVVLFMSLIRFGRSAY